MGCSKDLARKDTDTHSIEHTMGWLQLVGSLKLQVSFAEYRLFYRALLQKRPTVLRSLLIVATPYLHSVEYITRKQQHTINKTIIPRKISRGETLQTLSNILEEPNTTF